MSWTDERVELLAKLWLGGLSASQIAAELGAGITRNAVIGKVHRLGLAGRAKPAANATPRPRQKIQPRSSGRMTSTLVRGNTALAAAPEIISEAVVRPVEEVIVPLAEPVTIIDLREAMCRWPMGDPASPDFRFCGARTPTGMPYCEGHRRLAYQPAYDRRRERERERERRERR